MPITPQLLERLASLAEENNARMVLRTYALGRIYPNGVVPPWGVSLCREWLREGCAEDSFEFHLLNLVEIGPDDQVWSLDGVLQGGVWNLIEWILGRVSREDAGWVHTETYLYRQMLVSEAKFAAERQCQNASYTASRNTPS